MKTVTKKFKQLRDLKDVEGVQARVYLTKIKMDSTTEITKYITYIGVIEDRIEADLNNPVISTVSFTVKNDKFQEHKFLTDGGLDGFFDKLFNGDVDDYQVKIKIEIDGATDELLQFDGRIIPDSIDMPGDLKTANFTADGWLRKAKETTAEGIADIDNSPFKNITGISFVKVGGKHPRIGARTMEYGITDGVKWLSYDNGEKVDITADGDYTLLDAVEESNIEINADIKKMPSETETDYFTIKDHEGVLTACYWYENRDLKFIVKKVLEEGGVPISGQDINVEEIESDIEKQFIYLPKIDVGGSVANLKVTALRVVDYNSTTHVITMIMCVEKKADHVEYKLEIDTDDPTNYTATEIPNSFTDNRIVKIIYFNARWWAICAMSHQIMAGGWAYQYWYARRMQRFATDFESFDKTVVYPFDNTGSSQHWICAPSISGDNTVSGNSSVLYMLRQEYTDAPTYYAKLYKYYYDPGVSDWVFENVKNLGSYVIDQYGTYTKQDYGGVAKEYFYYLARPGTDTDHIYYQQYKITDDGFLTFWEANRPGDELSIGVQAKWVKAGASLDNRPFLQFYDRPEGHYYSLIVNSDGTYLFWEDGTSGSGPRTAYVNANARKRTHYTFWHESGGEKNILFCDVSSGIFYRENEKLLSSLDGEITAPQIFTGTANDYFFVGAVNDGIKIVPFLYMSNKMPTIKVADFTEQNCKEALRELAEGYLDFFTIYEKEKARFYYRETDLGDTIIIDSDKVGKDNIKIKWSQAVDGVIVENSREDLRWRKGITDYGKKVIRIDNRFVSEGTGETVAQWYWDFFKKSRKIIEVKAPLLLEAELMDKANIIIRDENDNSFYSFDAIICEKSFLPSIDSGDSFLVNLKLREIGGTEVKHLMLEDDIEMLIPILPFSRGIPGI